MIARRYRFGTLLFSTLLTTALSLVRTSSVQAGGVSGTFFWGDFPLQPRGAGALGGRPRARHVKVADPFFFGIVFSF